MLALEEQGGSLSKLPSIGRGVVGSVKSGLTTAAEYGSRALSKAGSLLPSTEGVGSRLWASAGDAMGSVKGSFGRAGTAISDSLASIGGQKVLGSVSKVMGNAIAPLAGAYEAYTAVNDETKTTTEKAQGVANAAGGVAGGIAGGELGAAIGTAILPGIGTAVGGVMGGIAGYFGGEAFINSVGTSISDSLADSKIGEVLGKGVAVVMSPFSEDARAAVKKDWATNMEALDNTLQPLTDYTSSLLDKLGDYTEALGKATGQIGDSVKGAATTMWAGIKSGASQIAEGYSKNGLRGAASAASAAGSTVLKSASSASTQVSDAVKLAGATLGAVSEKYESGGKGVGTVSSGKGDAGGVSYGKYQLATNNKSMDTFLASKEGAPVASQLQGLAPGSKAFNDKYKELTTSPEGAKAMEDAQHAYIQRTHFEPQAAKLKNDLGMDVGKESKAVQEAVWSTSVQYGKDTGVISNALKGKDLSTMSDKEKIAAIQDYKAAHVAENFKSSSPEVQAGVARRIDSEKQTLLAVGDVGKKNQTQNQDQTGPLGTIPSAVAMTTTSATPKVSVHTATESTAAAAKEAQASASPMPSSLIGQGTPTEVQSVQVTNQPQPVAPTVVAQASPSGSQSTQPTLDEIPMYINDLGMVLLNIGHV
jgi:hypothetical protein